MRRHGIRRHREEHVRAARAALFPVLEHVTLRLGLAARGDLDEPAVVELLVAEAHEGALLPEAGPGLRLQRVKVADVGTGIDGYVLALPPFGVRGALPRGDGRRSDAR